MLPCSPKPQGGLHKIILTSPRALPLVFFLFLSRKGCLFFVIFLPGTHQHTEQPVVPDHTTSSQNEVHARNDLLNTCEIPNKHLN